MSIIIESPIKFDKTINRMRQILFTNDDLHVEFVKMNKESSYFFKTSNNHDKRKISYSVLEGVLYLKKGLDIYKFEKGTTFTLAAANDPIIIFSDPSIGTEMISVSNSRDICPNTVKFATYLNELKEKLKCEDSITYSHCERVMHLSFLLGLEANLMPKQLYLLKIAALMHDVGKLSIENSILHAQRKLTDNEFLLIKKHPQTGARLFNNENFYEGNILSQIIQQHHERLDGFGYPKKLKEKEILIESKIISIVDTFDAILNNRSYSRSLSINDAKKELLSVSDSQLDKELVKKFISILDNPSSVYKNFKIINC